MKTLIVHTLVFIGLSTVFITPSACQTNDQAWKDHPIRYEDIKHRGILRAQYHVVRQRAGCRLTIRLTNTSGRTLSHYWFAFKFMEGHEHENAITDQIDGDSLEMTYESCGIQAIVISEVE